jgi:acetylornithine deacetylase/succinyl-diaminopimelate desuccinylase-like protein
MPAPSPEEICRLIDRQRLLDTAIALVEVPSPTRSAGAVAERLAQILTDDGFAVERPEADWPEAPAVVTRLEGADSGRTLQFDGHLDTVHLPFVPPRQDGTALYGSGASDMKGGIAACVEAMRVLRQSGALHRGGVLLTAHDHHEGPWGDRRQVQALIRQGCVGDAVLLPEYLADRLPVAGRGMAIFEVRLWREGEKSHEVLSPPGVPDVLGTGAALAAEFAIWRSELAQRTRPHAGSDAVFVGQIESGEIYNQVPVACTLKGTRRWGEPGTAAAVQEDFIQRVQQRAAAAGVEVEIDYDIQGDAFSIATEDPLVAAFQGAHTDVTGAELPVGGKPFVDDGNTYGPMAGIPALTHGPAATGAHTLDERVPIDELVRVAQVYALTALNYC